MDHSCCGNCGKELAGDGGRLCADCKEGAGRKNRKRLWYSSFAVALFLLAGAAFLYAEKQPWDFSWDALIGRPAALVNGEPIARSEARERLQVSRLMLEKTYGKGLFAGEEGRELLGRLERDVLEKMVEERLVAREAERLQIRVDDERVRQEIEKIGQEIYGNRENFRASLKEDGISDEYLTNHIRNLLVRQEFKKAQPPPNPKTDPDAHFAAWLTQKRQSATVSFNPTIPPTGRSAQAGASCCGSGGGGGSGGCGSGGCGTKQDPALIDPTLKSKAGEAALAEYHKLNPAEKGLEARVTDYGCHIQVDIEKGGRTVRSYRYQDGRVTDQ